MKKLHILVIPCLMLSSVAHAEWTGLYAGGNVGYSWNSSNMKTDVASQGTYFADSSVTTIDALGSGEPTSSNVIGGGQVGYHWQSDALVIGFELDIDSYSTSTTQTVTAVYPCCSPSTFTNKQSIETTWMTTLRPHVGYVYSNFMAYVTGGLAITDLTMTNKFTDDYADAYEKASHPSTKAGWTAGAGVEYAINSAWSIGAQYLYTSFGTVSHKGTLTDNSGATSELNHEADLNSNIVRLNINCHFG